MPKPGSGVLFVCPGQGLTGTETSYGFGVSACGHSSSGGTPASTRWGARGILKTGAGGRRGPPLTPWALRGFLL